jgi:hypothetical protein
MSGLPSPETMFAYASAFEKPYRDYRGGVLHEPGEPARAAAAALRIVAGLWACTGCGSMKSLDQILGEHPNAISCCPERKMIARSADGALRSDEERG